MRAIAFLTLILVGCSTAPKPTAANNAELEKLLAADQQDREGAWTQIDWPNVTVRDADRRKRVLEMIEAKSVVTGKDFERAALVFQHGDTSNDILLAHILAVTALGKGNMNARRMAAISLDRYLNRTNNPQVFGTQFNSKSPKDPAAWTMEPYDPNLIGDALRALNCVEPVEIQRRILEDLQHERESADSNVCPEMK